MGIYKSYTATSKFFLIEDETTRAIASPECTISADPTLDNRFTLEFKRRFGVGV